MTHISARQAKDMDKSYKDEGAYYTSLIESDDLYDVDENERIKCDIDHITQNIGSFGQEADFYN